MYGTPDTWPGAPLRPTFSHLHPYSTPILIGIQVGIIPFSHFYTDLQVVLRQFLPLRTTFQALFPTLPVKHFFDMDMEDDAGDVFFMFRRKRHE
jgi:hypothetical protein